MKKLVSVVAAVAAAAAMAVTAFAQAPSNTVITNRQGSTDPDPSQADTTVKFSIDPSYTITIPKTVELTTKNADDTYSGTGKIEADNVFIENGQKVNVNIQSASNFTMKTADDGATLEYKVSTGSTDIANNGLAASFVNTEHDEVELAFTTKTAPQYSGDYSDTVVFVISVGQ